MKPIEVSKVEIAFPACVSHLMPSKDEPGYQKYRDDWNHESSWGFKLFNEWFYSGVKELKLYPKEGINSDKAMNHIRCIMHSFEPSHEDKTAACAFLFEHWFEKAEWEKNDKPNDNQKR